MAVEFGETERRALQEVNFATCVNTCKLKDW